MPKGSRDAASVSSVQESVLSTGTTLGMDLEWCNCLLSSTVGSWALLVVFKKEGAGEAVVRPSDGEDWQSESRP